jgi:hypothetical protein
MKDFTPYAQKDPKKPDCKLPDKDLPEWVTSGFGGHLFVYDDVRDPAYTATWAGHDIPAVLKKICLHEDRFQDGGNATGHEVWNETHGDRVVLFLDVARPLRFPTNVLNKLIIWLVRFSPMVRNGMKRQAVWEDRLDERVARSRRT